METFRSCPTFGIIFVEVITRSYQCAIRIRKHIFGLVDVFIFLYRGLTK
jgi:hypothetical protein